MATTANRQELPNLLDALELIGEIFRMIKMEAEKHPEEIPLDPCGVIEKALKEEGDLRDNLRTVLQKEKFNVDAVINYASTLERFFSNKPPVRVYRDRGRFNVPPTSE